MAHKKYGWRIAGFVFKGLCSLLIIGIIGLLAWRIIDRNIVPKAVKTITPNEILCEAYAEHGENLTMFYQEQTEYTREDKNYGYFANSGSVFIDEAEQLQFVLRYNNSTVKYTARDYTYYEVTDDDGNKQIFHSKVDADDAAYKIDPTASQEHIKEIIPDLSRDGDLYDVTVTIMYDLTPDNDKDNDGKTPEAVKYQRFYPSEDVISYKKTLYNYRKYIFDGIKIDENVLAVMVDIYYVNDVDYDKDAYGTLLLYYYEEDNTEYKLSSADKKAIMNYLK